VVWGFIWQRYRKSRLTLLLLVDVREHSLPVLRRDIALDSAGDAVPKKLALAGVGLVAVNEERLAARMRRQRARDVDKPPAQPGRGLRIRAPASRHRTLPPRQIRWGKLTTQKRARLRSSEKRESEGERERETARNGTQDGSQCSQSMRRQPNQKPGQTRAPRPVPHTVPRRWWCPLSPRGVRWFRPARIWVSAQCNRPGRRPQVPACWP